MFQAILKRTNAQPLIIDLPADLTELPLNRLIDFQVEAREFDNPDANVYAIMAKAVSAFTGYPLAEIIEAEVGDYSDADLMEGVEAALTGLFGYCSNLCANAKGRIRDTENASFVYMGRTFKIPVIRQLMLTREFQLAPLSVIETVEALEINRLAELKVKGQGDPTGALRKSIMDAANEEANALEVGNRDKVRILNAAERRAEYEIEKAGDPDGSLMYSRYLRLLAVLCRQENEKLPFDDAERQAWISERMVFFRQIDAQTALDVDFFLSSILQGYAKSRGVVRSLSAFLLSLALTTHLRNPQPTKKRNSGAKKHSGA